MTEPGHVHEHDEARAIAERYARREVGDRYHPLRPEIWQSRHDRERALIRLLRRHVQVPVAALDVLEVGCGHGDNLLELLRLGFDPAHLQGLELLPERHAQARAVLPAGTVVWLGDATLAEIAPASQDLVLQSTVFTSLLDDGFQQRLADTMWRWVKPGGAVLWYDFTVNNPRNPDVRGVPLARLRQLFPQACIDARRVTLAPPLARIVCTWHPSLYTVFNAVPLLRTHLLAWIQKPP